ncbi:MAG: hypothetical protein AAFP69_17615, partial [Planctomycetota bacterium]
MEVTTLQNGLAPNVRRVSLPSDRRQLILSAIPQIDIGRDQSQLRLKDIAMPVSFGNQHWQSIANVAIARVPSGFSSLRIDIRRVQDLLKNESRLHPDVSAIQWIGPGSVLVSRRDAVISSGDRTTLQPVRYEASPKVADRAELQKVSGAFGEPNHTIPVETQLRQLRKWLQYAIQRHSPSLRNAFDMRIAPDSDSLRGLGDAVGVVDVSFVPPSFLHSDGQPNSAEQHLILNANMRMPGGVRQADIPVVFSPRPAQLVPVRSIPRGHILRPADLHHVPVPPGRRPPSRQLLRDESK